MQEVRRLASACRLTENELDEMWRLQREETERTHWKYTD